MDQTHVHLLITHLPIFGSLLGAIVLIYGLITKSIQTTTAAYILFVISSIGAGIAYLTGEAAEETVEDLPVVIKSIIEEHEEFALFALISLIILGVASGVGLFINSKKSFISRPFSLFIFLLSIISFVIVARTGYIGGQIRHSEIRISYPLNSNPSEEEKDDE